MEKPSECRWCGAGREKAVLATETFFACGSCIVYGDWGQSAECEKRSLRDRIQRALKRLETATRFELVKDDYGAYMKGRDSYGNWLDVIEIEQAIEILKGDTDDEAE